MVRCVLGIAPWLVDRMCKALDDPCRRLTLGVTTCRKPRVVKAVETTRRRQSTCRAIEEGRLSARKWEEEGVIAISTTLSLLPGDEVGNCPPGNCLPTDSVTPTPSEDCRDQDGESVAKERRQARGRANWLAGTGLYAERRVASA